MSLKLSGSDDELRNGFFNLWTRSDVANLLDVSEKDLIYYLYRLPDEDKYTKFEIPKKSGSMRIITSPIGSIKLLQRKFLQVLETVYSPKLCVHGFVKGRSIRTNALRHRNQRYVFNFDLKDFFPSINFGRIRGMFRSKPYKIGDNAATILAQLCCFDNQLPQGAPTSPIIANMICGRLDSQLQKIARENKCYYTRFADDITFSTSLSAFPVSIAIEEDEDWKVGEEIRVIVKDNGFDIQLNKIRVQANYQRQVVTGVTVNEFPNVSRKFVRQIRAMLHDWEVNGYENALQRHLKTRDIIHRNPNSPKPEFKNIIEGKISFLRMVRNSVYGEDNVYTRLLDKYNYLVGKEDWDILPDMDVSESILFLSYARKDEKFAFKLYKNLSNFGENVWIDQKQIRAGKKWSDEIEAGLEKCDIMVLIVSHSSMNSTNVADEWEYFHTNKKPIMPILLYGSETIFPFQLQRIQWIDFRQNEIFVSNLNKLRKAIYNMRLLQNPSES